MLVYKCDLCNKIFENKSEMVMCRVNPMTEQDTNFYRDGYFHTCYECTNRILNMFEEASEKKNTPKEIKVVNTNTPIKSKLDDGKIKALRNAGWTLEKIADEMHCAPQTVANHLNAMGER